MKAKKRVRPRSSGPTVLQYKVVELSTVDENSVERAVNQWVGQGWVFDGLQFAMRDSSKRPSMAFAFFTKSVPASGANTKSRFRSKSESDGHLRRLVNGADDRQAPVDAWTRLSELAGDEEVE